ncbi:response regulator with CheY-like receiver, AAA-type ATPase, and DNA-binding domains [Burkholderiales bacterium JOSHI_001]|nr:response regulator with CheY-like receiver, AAA-type ATPase, and DNA-binding domains [Burkholderiales bacterium JOSHI_001]
MKATILVVDDSASLRSVVRLMLERAGYRVAEAIDGRDALRKVADLRPALVLCDVNMPGLDGLGLVRQIKSQPAYRAIPVLMLTTSTDKAQKAEAAVAGAQAWITKPVQPEVLLGAVARLMPQATTEQENA